MPAPADVLVVNSGSTSVKLALVDTHDTRWMTTLDGDDVHDHRVEAIADAIRDAPLDEDGVAAVGHRIVHGGSRFHEPVLVDAEVEAGIREVAALAPLHNQIGLDGIAAARRALGDGVPNVAVFDTAFHHTMPVSSAAYGGPFEWIERGLHRYGFHGISHEYAAHEAAGQLGRSLDELRLVTCHLGGGCSITAVERGHSIDTTMGFTPLEGLVMTTRAGSVDPGLLLHLLRTGTSLDTLDHVLEHESGLTGLSGVSDDLREVIAARDAGNERARLAVDVFVHRVCTGVGAMIGALGRPDALVFTGGIGERSAEIRDRVAGRFSWTGAAVLVVAAHEELAIARAALVVLHRRPTPGRGTTRSHP